MGKRKPEVKIIDTDTADPERDVKMHEVDYGLQALKQFGEGTFDAVIGLAKAIGFAFAFAFDGLRDLYKRKRKKK